LSSALQTEASGWRTGAFLIGDAPNPLALVFDHQKAIATLAAAFLALSVGFADKLVQISEFSWAPHLLIAVWVLLGVAVILILAGSAKLQGYLLKPPENPADPIQVANYKRKYNVAATQTGFAALCLVIAAILFAVFGAGIVLNPKDKVKASVAARNAIKFASALPGNPQAHWRVKSVTFDDEASVYRVEVTQEGSMTSYVVTIKKADGEPQKLDQKLTAAAPNSAAHSIDPADVQRRLNALGFGAGKADGVIGRRTTSAIRKFQARNQLPATGSLDTRTLALLGSAATPGESSK
jgi:hypothetical protein